MEIITTHVNTDLDGLAAVVAAQKLYPGAELIFPGKLSRNVEEFLALHKDTLKNVRSIKDINIDKVKRIIMVDTKSPGRVSKLKELFNRPEVEVHIYDHHPRAEGDVCGKVEVVETVGAATTLLIERIRAKGLEITPLEATIMALGIYEDTGCLVFTSTTPRDIRAAAFLLEQGANLAVVADFLGRPLTQDQKSLLKKLLVTAEHHQINGTKVLIARGNVDEFVGGLALLTHKLSEIERTDAVFAVVEMEDRVHLVGRCALKEVNCKDIMVEFGGGGHPAAASATVKGKTVEEIAERLLELVKEKIHPLLTVKDIMSSPVKMVFPETTIEEAGKIMLRYGHTGLPVIKDGKLSGVISRRDVEKATHHGLGHAPVKGYMTTNVITVQKDMNIHDVQDLMIEKDIGRLPVVEGNMVIGIVSRTDVLQTLHEGFKGRYSTTYNEKQNAKTAHIRPDMQRALPSRIMNILTKAGEVAEGLNYQVYAVGGLVRDVLLKVENLDVDLVVEGNGIEMANELAKVIGGRVRPHEKFGTAEIIFPDGYWVDVVTARVEYYEYPAALPQVEQSSLKHDLYRRDFTINAMAVALNPERFGELVDYFNGREDLQNGAIRVLHNLSFIEDPTRILRAIRFEQRYDMDIEPQTLRLIKEAVREKVIARLSTERMWGELKHILEEADPEHMLDRLSELGVWDYLFPEITFWEVQYVISEIPQALMILRNWGWAEPAEKWLPYFLSILHLTAQETAYTICQRYNLGRRQTEKVLDTIAYGRVALRRLSATEEVPLSELTKIVQTLPREAYPMFLTLLEDKNAIRRFRLVMESVNKNKPTVNGKDIRDMGYQPGPMYRRALDSVWQARLDGMVQTREEELEYIRSFLEHNNAPKIQPKQPKPPMQDNWLKRGSKGKKAKGTKPLV
ncbi:Polynucleotide adenylyltransferase region [Desulforamulus reducens MI-1]|uniref:Polynucleotide adenylyltransferase region n=1 Tax=Desulforamulus reducens (strain ATCC BAA-1160 / DSM 100696 / MI-1) TaxID=349161 RepID=A4J3L2_DESRM|nr:CBS domain-containing protein [Desulforamulus reducens]ABO49665.1 Polynucleotide adenylyltransferase region [Desulforamulus reducens MI-1]